MAITEKYIIVCDDFRREDNGKFILVGIYVPDIGVAQIPVILQPLTFFCVLEADSPGNFKMSFRLRHEDAGRNIFEGAVPVGVADPSQPIVIPIKVSQVQFTSSGLYTFSLEFDGQAPIVKTFTVRLNVMGRPNPGQPR
jgi:hypothetical protein